MIFKRHLKIARWPKGTVLFGGAVRDHFLRQKSTDFDWLVEDAEQSAKDFATESAAVFPLDEERGVWRVINDYVQHDFVALNGLTIEGKLARSDFTINAMAMMQNNQTIDPFYGHSDLKNKLIRAINYQNLLDDPLRPLRAVRFVAQFGFRIEKETIEWIKTTVEEQIKGFLEPPAAERVGYELCQLLQAKEPILGLRVMDELGLFQLYLPEILLAKGVEQGGFHHLDVFEHSIEALKRLLTVFPQADLATRFATLFHDIAKPATKSWNEEQNRYSFYGHDKLGAETAKKILTRWRLANEIIDKVANLIKLHMSNLPNDYKSAKRFVHRHRQVLPELLQLMLADRESARGPQANEFARLSYQKAFALVIEALEEPPPAKPLLTSQEVMDLLNIEPGPKLGQAIKFLQEAQAIGDAFDQQSAKKLLLAEFGSDL